MKKVIAWSVLSFAVLACTQNQKPAEAPSKNAEAKAQFEKNLATLKAGISAFENEQIDQWAASVADNAVWNSPAYGSPAGTKDDWKKALSFYLANWDSLKLKNAMFLPGIDSATNEPDGSVRYYGQWIGVHKSGVKTSLSFYATYEFNKENKITEAAEFFDLGGMMNAVAAKGTKAK